MKDIERITDIINEMIGADPHAMTELCNFRVSCNNDLKELSNVSAFPIKDELGRTKYTIGFIGLLNAVLSSINKEKIAILGKINEKKNGLILVEHCYPYNILFPPEKDDN